MVDTNHSLFLKFLDESHAAVWRVAGWLKERGFPVVVMPITKAKTRSEWQDHSDSGDLYIQQRVEVKRLTANFTGQHDWPFGDKFIVCSRHSFDRAKPKPYAYVILNSDMTHAAIVKTDTRDKWTVSTRTDSRFVDHTQEFYFCPLDNIKWETL
jgi:hypothetical protein